MRVPFIHSTAAGLSITGTEVVWVSGTRRGSRLRRLEETHEAVENGDVRAALARLVERVRPSDPYVATHLDPVHIRHVIVQGPALDDETGFEAWLEDEAVRRLPPGASPNDFAVRVQVLEQTEESTRCLLALVRREAVEQQRALLEAVGLEALGMGSSDMAFSAALWFNPAFAEGQSAVLLLRPADAVLMPYQDGLLQSMIPLASGTAMTDALSLVEEVAMHMTPAPDRLFVVGTEAAAFIAQAREVRLFECPLHEEIVDPAFFVDASTTSAGYAPAAALALQQLFSAREALNFLEPAEVSPRLQEIEKAEAVRALLMLGSILGALYLLVTFVTVYLGGKQAAAEATLDTLAGEAAQIEETRRTVTRLEQDIAQAERLMVERTHVAGTLERIGQGVPDGLWLEALALQADASAEAHLTLTGVAYQEGDVAHYLDYLERTPFATRVRLLYAEAVGTLALYRQAKVQDRPVTRFELQLALAPFPTYKERPPQR